jgi:hypothetical protein
MKKYIFLASVLVLVIVGLVVAQGFLFRRFSEDLSGYAETPLALSTTGNGEFRGTVINTSGQQEIRYTLSYAQLEGNVLQSHIHFGSAAQTGGISVFLCTNLGNGPAGTQACPAAPATITGTIVPANVIGPAGQGITAGQFDELIQAMRAGRTYVNVHSSLYQGGEIRSQIDLRRADRGDDEDDHDDHDH